ncbi:hypothetical protein DUNSADRAFT_16964 [Dunaliella salina]|uniref:Arrestin C-terminal-like domain-containing protein n=1 Tax=Dunaliella salina TaxID=3046 RepID=A0ABQ7G2M7_DUNSA|nr:hypothetical protein DUNSADRAFT_16964 [Dunaliella salina]|eukprot:KAF5828862.1 hypothetical protein DUNSADRAFT_16964 [Dunaliella salina]
MRLVERLDSDGIKLKAIGEIRTKWREHRSTGQSSYVQTFSGKESVMKGEHMLTEKGMIQPGMYSYPFEFSLPETLPASMDWDQKTSSPLGDYKSFGFNGRASISYFVQAIGMKAGTLSRDIKSEPLSFTVLSCNTVTPSGPFTVAEAQDSVVCCCFKKGSLSGSLTVATNLVEPGSKLSYTAELTNDSTGVIQFVEVSLKQRVTLFGSALGNSTGSKQVFVGDLNQEKIPLSQDQLQPGGKAKKFTGDLGPVPQGLPMTLSHLYIKVESYVELLAKMGPLTKSFRLEAPVILGVATRGPTAIMEGPAVPAFTPTPASPYPFVPPCGDSEDADPETSPFLMYSYPKLDAPLDWSPLIFKPASLKLSAGAAVTHADDDGVAEDYFRKNGW